MCAKGLLIVMFYWKLQLPEVMHYEVLKFQIDVFLCRSFYFAFSIMSEIYLHWSRRPPADMSKKVLLPKDIQQARLDEKWTILKQIFDAWASKLTSLSGLLFEFFWNILGESQKEFSASYGLNLMSNLVRKTQDMNCNVFLFFWRNSPCWDHQWKSALSSFVCCLSCASSLSFTTSMSL